MTATQKVSPRSVLIELARLLARQTAREWLEQQQGLAGNPQFSNVQHSNDVPKAATRSKSTIQGGAHVA